MDILLYGDSERNADMYYLSKIFVPDPFLAFKVGKKRVGVFSALEYARAQKESNFNFIFSLEDCFEKAKKRYRTKSPDYSHVIRLIAEELNVQSLTVADSFAYGLAHKLKGKLKLDIAQGPLFPERLIKTDEEARFIRQGNAASEAGLKAAENALKASIIKGNKLYLDGKILTSERLQTLINIAALEAGAIAQHTIAAGGDQACDPHCSGSGPLRPNELIIVDVFPRNTATGYHGDMTRTFLKGTASEGQKRLVETVKKAQKLGLKALKSGTTGKAVHEVVDQYFLKEGYETQKKGGVHEGFFHSTGHGLGLDIHEEPRVSKAGGFLKTGMVVTIEPGLYYPGLGGCRIEDVAIVEPGGYKLLSKYHYTWQIR